MCESSAQCVQVSYWLFIYFLFPSHMYCKIWHLDRIQSDSFCRNTIVYFYFFHKNFKRKKCVHSLILWEAWSFSIINLIPDLTDHKKVLAAEAIWEKKLHKNTSHEKPSFFLTLRIWVRLLYFVLTAKSLTEAFWLN